VALLSLEPWDAVWRRNQYLASELTSQGLVRALTYVEPAQPGRGRRLSPIPCVDVVRPPLVIPRRFGGLQQVAFALRAELAQADLVWVNDAPIGELSLRHLPIDRPAVYDVTDDWRTLEQPARITARLVAAEDALAERAAAIVCSPELQQRWTARYGRATTLVRNGIDPAAFAHATRRAFDGPGPHIGYVGSLHSARLDIGLVAQLAGDSVTVHLVGPDYLDLSDRQLLTAAGVRLHPPVAAADVPSWLMSFDVLVCPHRITEFTLSLDAIKAYEYLAAGRPIVATPTSGFQELVGRSGVQICATAEFGREVANAVIAERPAPVVLGSWAERAREFAAALGVAA
jgi:glycosyltransferase involved in cell wall biosynthesis